MQLTQFTDYSLRALIYIATSDSRCTIDNIADAYSISKNHLIKIVHNLSKLGVINTMRGKNGGIMLAQEPSQLNLKSLVLKLEPHFDLVPCFNIEKQNCCIAPACKLKHVLYEAKLAFFDVLEHYTLEDVIQNKEQLQKILVGN